jgi:hypothetical protein
MRPMELRPLPSDVRPSRHEAHQLPFVSINERTIAMKNLMIIIASIFTFAGAAAAFTGIDQIDADGNGSASFPEVLATAPTMNMDDFRSVDVDNANAWDRFEVETATAQRLLNRDLDVQPGVATISSLDTNGDGNATFDELSDPDPDAETIQRD